MIFTFFYEDSLIRSFEEFQIKCKENSFSNSNEILKFIMSEFNVNILLMSGCEFQ